MTTPGQPPLRSLVVLLAAGQFACGGAAPPPETAPAPPPSVAKPALPVAPPSSPWASLYPKTRTVDAKDTLFGTEVRDPYRWLEDAKSNEVQDWMKAEDTLTRAKLSALPSRAGLVTRLTELAYVDAQSPPFVRGSRVFYWRRSGKQDKWVVYYREGKAGVEKVLLDPNTWSTDGSTSLHDTSVSWDGKRVAYTVSQNNSDEATLHVMEVATGKVSTVDTIEGARYAQASWTPKGDGFYYTWLPTDPKIPEDQRPGYQEVRFHELGRDPAKDVTVREKTGDPTKSLSAVITKDGRWLALEIGKGWTAMDVLLKDARSPLTLAAPWQPLTEGRDALFGTQWFRGKFYVTTNDGAPRSRVFVVDPAHLERTAWKEIVPERPDATLDSAHILGGKLALTYLKDVTSRIELHDLDGKLLREVPLPGLGNAWITGDRDRDEAFWGFETYNTPSEIHVTSIAAPAKAGDPLWFKIKAPVDSAAYVVEQVFFTSKDGTRVPMFVVHAKSFVRDGTAPAYVTGYGGFNASEQPYFSPTLFPWLEHGGIFVDVNLRGGGEYGEAWHRAGMRHEKQHVFDDFEGALAALAKERLSSPERIVIEGGSNGGLLIGATLVQRPDLFRAAICAVPLLDMVRYVKFGSGRTWIDEYGTAEDEGDFRALFAYSPYHHVTPGIPYPSVLVDSADSDDRVDPMHARKMAAALQSASTGGPVLLRIEQHSGHGGADLVRAWVEREADHYAFALAEVAKQGGSVAP